MFYAYFADWMGQEKIDYYAMAPKELFLGNNDYIGSAVWNYLVSR